MEITSGSPNSAQITLSDYLIYLSRGDRFDAADYVVSYRFDGATVTGADGLTIDSKVNTTVPGIYEVYYTLDAATTSRTKLVVVVE